MTITSNTGKRSTNVSFPHSCPYAEERISLAVKKPADFTKGDLAAAKTDLAACGDTLTWKCGGA